MIASLAGSEPTRVTHSEEHQSQFCTMLPRIHRQARVAFRQFRAEQRDEMIQEVVANAFCAFMRLVKRGKTGQAYATPLAKYAIRQVLEGRRTGVRQRAGDVLSVQARRRRRIVVERLDRFDPRSGLWREVLLEDRHSTPAEIAAARIDVAAWLGSLPLRNLRIAEALAAGETTSDVARQFDLSRGRVSQLRTLFRSSWERFQGTSPQCAAD
jgi:hypothetical protein